ncbi:hypothetical protein ABIA18_000892 [Sinorhizobium fredii]
MHFPASVCLISVTRPGSSGTVSADMMVRPTVLPEVMTEGFRIDVSMEIDLRARADGGFAVLHDEVLEAETTGSGSVHRMQAAELRLQRMKDTRRAITLSEDLATMLVAAHPDALLQFDMKDDFATVGERGVEHLSDHFRDVGQQIIVSGADLDLILAIKRRLPDLKRGIDPTDKLVEIHRDAGLAAVERELAADLDGPTEPETIYLAWQLVLQAAHGGLDLIGLCHEQGQAHRRVDLQPQEPAGRLRRRRMAGVLVPHGAEARPDHHGCRSRH